jgi:hypothetical protein
MDSHIWSANRRRYGKRGGTVHQAFASSIINVAIEHSWARVRDFGAHHTWVPNATATELIGGQSTTVGVLRRMSFSDGPDQGEILTALDDNNWTLRYDFVGDSLWPMFDVHGVIRLRPVTSIRATYIERDVGFGFEGTRDDCAQVVAGVAGKLAQSIELLAEFLGHQPGRGHDGRG